MKFIFLVLLVFTGILAFSAEGYARCTPGVRCINLDEIEAKAPQVAMYAPDRLSKTCLDALAANSVGTCKRRIYPPICTIEVKDIPSACRSEIKNKGESISFLKDETLSKDCKDSLTRNNVGTLCDRKLPPVCSIDEGDIPAECKEQIGSEKISWTCRWDLQPLAISSAGKTLCIGDATCTQSVGKVNYTQEYGVKIGCPGRESQNCLNATKCMNSKTLTENEFEALREIESTLNGVAE